MLPIRNIFPSKGNTVRGERMKKYFHGAEQKGPYFEGWYFKCRTKAGKTIGLIPAFHIDRENRCSASLQVISEGGTWWLEYPAAAFSAAQTQLDIRIGDNVFSAAGLSAAIEQPGISCWGKLHFGPFLPLKRDIMGPFRHLPNMECSHGVISMTHAIKGKLVLNGAVYDFAGGTGYIETDRGRGFPGAYLWTQGSFFDGNLMLSVATIPLAGICFTGCICAVIHHGREFRLATYRGASAAQWGPGGAVVRQGKYRLEVEVLEQKPQPLHAPVNGAMGRRIHESLCAKIRYRFWKGETLLFDRTDCAGSFEYSDPDADAGM